MKVSTELTQKQAVLFKMFCNALHIKYESAGCYNLVHVTVFGVTAEQIETLNLFIDRLEEYKKEK